VSIVRVALRHPDFVGTTKCPRLAAAVYRRASRFGYQATVFTAAGISYLAGDAEKYSFTTALKDTLDHELWGPLYCALKILPVADCAFLTVQAT